MSIHINKVTIGGIHTSIFYRGLPTDRDYLAEQLHPHGVVCGQAQDFQGGVSGRYRLDIRKDGKPVSEQELRTMLKDGDVDWTQDR